MMGFVVSGLIKISYGFEICSSLFLHRILSTNHFISLSDPFHRIFGNLPVLSPILLVILLSLIAIVVYFYRSSALMSKKILTWLIVAFILIFLFVNGWLVFKNRPPRVDFRLTFVPLQADTQIKDAEWMGDALWTMVTKNIQSTVEKNAIVSPEEWISGIAVTDSIYSDSDYIKFFQKNKNEFFLYGKIESIESVPYLKFELVHGLDRTIEIRDSLALALQQLPEISKQISRRILSRFDLNLSDSDLVISFVSPQAYQDYVRAQRLYRDKRYAAAGEFAQKAVSADSNLIDAYLLLGKCYFQSGVIRKEQGESPVEEFEAARYWLTKSIAKDSLQSEAYIFLGEYYIYQERWSIAEDMLSQAFQLNPNIPRLYLALSRLHQFRFKKLGFRDEEALFQRAIFINPRFEDGYLALADYYLFENRRRSAIAVLEHYLSINPNSVPALMALGKIYLVRNDIIKIIEIFDRVLELQPDNADAFYNLGILYYNTEDFETAEKFFLRAIDLNNHLNANLYLAYLYEAKGNYEKAIEFLRRRIRFRKGPDDEFAEEARKHLFKLMQGDSTANFSNYKK